MAKDLRNQAPNILFVCRNDRDAAVRMQIVLSKAAVDQTRGDGGEGQGKQAHQVVFKCVVMKELLIAGRRIIVK